MEARHNSNWNDYIDIRGSASAEKGVFETFQHPVISYDSVCSLLTKQNQCVVQPCRDNVGNICL